MRRPLTLIVLCVPLLLLLALGLSLSAIECSAGWLNDRCQELFTEIYRGNGK